MFRYELKIQIIITNLFKTTYQSIIVFFFLRLIEWLFLDVTLQVVQPVACCSVQHHQVSFTMVQQTLAGNVLCGLVCSAKRWWWQPSHLVHIGVKPAIARSNTVQAHNEYRARSCPMCLFDGVRMNVLNRQRVVSHLVSQVPSAHALLVFPWASMVSCFTCYEKGWRDCNRFRPGVFAVTMLCSACWSIIVMTWLQYPKSETWWSMKSQRAEGVICISVQILYDGLDSWFWVSY